jgi:hypothetical protein
MAQYNSTGGIGKLENQRYAVTLSLSIVLPKAVDFALEFDDNIGSPSPQTTDWKCFYNAQIKRHGSNSWEYVSQDLFYWKEWMYPELNNGLFRRL